MDERLQPSATQDAGLRRLVTEGTLDAGQAAAVRSALWGSSTAAVRTGVSTVLIEVAGYVGGALMLGGAALLVGLSWEQLTRPARIGLLAGIAAMLVVSGLLLAGGPGRVWSLRDGHAPVRRRLVGVLLALAAAPAALATGTGVDAHEGLVAGLVGLAVALAGLSALPSAPGVLMTAAMSIVTVVAAVSDFWPDLVLVHTFAVIALGLIWASAAAAGVVSPRPLGLAIGAGLTILGSQLALGEPATAPLAYALTLAAAAGCFLLYWWQRVTVLLVAGVAAVTLAVPEAIADWTNGALSGPVVLLVAGAVLVAASVLGLRLRSARAG